MHEIVAGTLDIQMSRRSIHISLLIGLLLTAAACTSRYRLDLMMAIEGEPSRVSIESTQYVRQAQIGDPFSDRKLVTGDRAVLLVRTSARGETLPYTSLSKAIQFDENLQTDLYLEVSDPPQPGEWPLAGRSFVQILERFDKPIEEKIFLPEDSGRMRIDSVTVKYLFVSVTGDYSSPAGQVLSLSGKVRVDRR